eukprot:Rmarinus@m.17069
MKQVEPMAEYGPIFWNTSDQSEDDCANKVAVVDILCNLKFLDQCKLSKPEKFRETLRQVNVLLSRIPVETCLLRFRQRVVDYSAFLFFRGPRLLTHSYPANTSHPHASDSLPAWEGPSLSMSALSEPIGSAARADAERVATTLTRMPSAMVPHSTTAISDTVSPVSYPTVCSARLNNSTSFPADVSLFDQHFLSGTRMTTGSSTCITLEHAPVSISIETATESPENSTTTHTTETDGSHILKHESIMALSSHVSPFASSSRCRLPDGWYCTWPLPQLQPDASFNIWPNSEGCDALCLPIGDHGPIFTITGEQLDMRCPRTSQVLLTHGLPTPNLSQPVLSSTCVGEIVLLRNRSPPASWLVDTHTGQSVEVPWSSWVSAIHPAGDCVAVADPLGAAGCPGAVRLYSLRRGIAATLHDMLHDVRQVAAGELAQPPEAEAEVAPRRTNLRPAGGPALESRSAVFVLEMSFVVEALVFLPDGAHLAIAISSPSAANSNTSTSTSTSTVRLSLWEFAVRTNMKVGPAYPFAIDSIQVSPNGAFVLGVGLSSHGNVDSVRSAAVWVWSVDSGEVVANVNLEHPIVKSCFGAANSVLITVQRSFPNDHVSYLWSPFSDESRPVNVTGIGGGCHVAASGANSGIHEIIDSCSISCVVARNGGDGCRRDSGEEGCCKGGDNSGYYRQHHCYGRRGCNNDGFGRVDGCVWEDDSNDCSRGDESDSCNRDSNEDGSVRNVRESGRHNRACLERKSSMACSHSKARCDASSAGTPPILGLTNTPPARTPHGHVSIDKCHVSIDKCHVNIDQCHVNINTCRQVPYPLFKLAATSGGLDYLPGTNRIVGTFSRGICDWDFTSIRKRPQRKEEVPLPLLSPKLLGGTWSSDGSIVAYWTCEAVSFVSACTGATLHSVFLTHRLSGPCVVSPCGALAAVPCARGHVAVFCTATGRTARTYTLPRDVTVVAFSPSCRDLLVAGPCIAASCSLDPPRVEVLSETPLQPGRSPLAFHPVDPELLVCSQGAEVWFRHLRASGGPRDLLRRDLRLRTAQLRFGQLSQCGTRLLLVDNWYGCVSVWQCSQPPLPSLEKQLFSRNHYCRQLTNNNSPHTMSNSNHRPHHHRNHHNGNNNSSSSRSNHSTRLFEGQPCLSPDGSVVAMGYQGFLEIWGVVSGKRLWAAENPCTKAEGGFTHAHLSLSGDSRLLQVCEGGEVYCHEYVV